jgi:hypothetical protein
VELYEIITMITGVALALGAISYFFFGNTKWFSTSEHIFLAGNVAVILAGDVGSLIDSCFKLVAAGRVALLIPFFIGMLAFTRWTRFRWSARYPTAVLSGIGVGLMIGLQVRSSIVSMVSETVTDMVLGRPDRFSGTVMLVGFIAVLTYYLYSTKLSTPVREGRLKFLSKLGTYFLLLTGGYLFSQIYMVEGIDLAGTIFILWFRRSYEEITAFISRSFAPAASVAGTVSATTTASSTRTPAFVGITIAAVIVAGLGGYKFHRKRTKTKSQLL